MGRRKFRRKAEKNSERKQQKLVCKPKGRPPKKGTKKYLEYKQQIVPRINLSSLRDSLTLPSEEWSEQSSSPINSICLCKILHKPNDREQPVTVTHSLTIHSDGRWEASAFGHQLNRSTCQPLSTIPMYVDQSSLQQLLEILDKSSVCAGHPEEKFVGMMLQRKGKKIDNKKGGTSAYLDDTIPVMLHGQQYNCTVRAYECEILCHGSKCQACVAYRATLRGIHHSWQKRLSSSPSKRTSTSSRTNFCHLQTPEKALRHKNMKIRTNTAERHLKRLKEKINKMMESGCVELDDQMNSDLLKIMEENTERVKSDFAENSFQRLFWEQQLKSTKVKDKRQMRWHPMIIKWCLHLKTLSSAAYHAFRTSGFITLPSERTLRDYTHLVRSAMGIQSDVNEQLIKEVNVTSLEEWQKYVVVLFDEVKIKEDLVYNRNTFELIGYVNLGQFNNQLMSLNSSDNDFDPKFVATHMLVFMVRGLFIDLEFPYAQFATKTACAADIFPIVWEVVRNLECCGLKVIAITCDGASANRKFFKMHKSSKPATGDKSSKPATGNKSSKPATGDKSRSSKPATGDKSSKSSKSDGSMPLYKTTNPYSQDKRPIYFISDVPHLIKTTRNCWSHSFGHGNTRKLWINGKHISWQHLRDLYKKTHMESGLTFLKKLKHDHLNLNSYSRMRVDLAAQLGHGAADERTLQPSFFNLPFLVLKVLSSSVADAFAYFADDSTTETERFVRYFDRFFDCMNVRCFTECFEHRKPDLRPYRSPKDNRLKWLKEDFLLYLKEWQTSIEQREGFTNAEKQTMCLSKETLLGLRMTVLSFVEMAEFLLQLPGVQYLFSERFCQDRLEAFFGKQRACGGRSENPTAKLFLDNTVSIRVQGSVALDPVRGNCRKRRQAGSMIDETPLPKRKRTSKC